MTQKGTHEMSHRTSRAVALLAWSALAWGCAGDQKRAESAATQEKEQAPVMTTTPPSGDANAPAPSGQPAGLPRAEPPPEGLNSGNTNNALAAPPAASPTPAQPTLTEGQMAKVADVVNTAEVEQGKLAQNRAKSARVRAFAAKMVKHHQQAKNEQALLVKRLGLAPADSSEAAALKAEGDAGLTRLRGASGADFDTAYLDSQVTAHEKVLATIDEQLLPSATSSEVRRALQVAREAVASHLAEAKTLRSELSTSSSK
jgi:putative membrane protein